MDCNYDFGACIPRADWDKDQPFKSIILLRGEGGLEPIIEYNMLHIMFQDCGR